MALFRIESGASYDMSYEGEFEEPMGVAVGDDVGLAVGGDDETSDAAPVSRVPSSLSLRRGSRLSLHRASCFSMHALNLSLRDHLSECTEMLAAEPALARAIVAHRGFHAIDDALEMPLENTLDAYEAAWRAGVTLCECDVGLTSDGHLVLCHDQNFARLALASVSSSKRALADTPLGGLTLSDVKHLPLASGASAPTLVSVLEAARAESPHHDRACRLVVELKGLHDDDADAGGGVASALALVALLEARPELVPHVAVIMSFDAPLCRACKKALRESAALAAARAPRVLVLTHLPEPDQPGCDRELAARLFGDDGDAADENARALAAWVRGDPSAGDVELDGAYIEYEPEMEHDAARLARVIEACGGVLGVWTHACGPGDGLSTARALVGAGVSFVNSDFQATFLQA